MKLREILRELNFILQPQLCSLCSSWCKSDLEKSILVCNSCIKKFTKLKKSKCPRCALEFPSFVTPKYECPNCHNKKFYFKRAFVGYSYKGICRKVIREYKFHAKLEYVPILTSLLCYTYNNEVKNINPDILIPMPIHYVKKIKRGFNQSEILLKNMAKIINVPIAINAVKRKFNTTPQYKLTEFERKRNIKDAFEVKKKIFEDKTVLILDDILTTGISLSELALKLKQAGAKTVYAMAIAR